MHRQSTFNIPLEESPAPNINNLSAELKRNIKRGRKQMVSTLTRKKKKLKIQVKKIEKFVPKIDMEKYMREEQEIATRKEIGMKEAMEKLKALEKSQMIHAKAALKFSKAIENIGQKKRKKKRAKRASLSLDKSKLDCITTVAKIGPVVLDKVIKESPDKGLPEITRNSLHKSESCVAMDTQKQETPFCPLPILKPSRNHGIKKAHHVSQIIDKKDTLTTEFTSTKKVAFNLGTINTSIRKIKKHSKGLGNSSFNSSKDLTPVKIEEEEIPKPTGIARKRKYIFPVKWEERRLEGIALRQHNPAFINEIKIQGFMIADSLRVLSDNIFQVRFILQKGLKMKIKDVLTEIPLECRISLNYKLEELTGYLFMAGKMLLQEYASSPDTIGISDVSDELQEKIVIDEFENFFEVMNTFGLVYEFFKDCFDAYKLLLKSRGRSSFSIEEFLKLEYIISKSRYLSNNVEEQYKLYENSLVNKEKN